MDTYSPESFASDRRSGHEYSALYDMEVEQALLGNLIAEEKAFDQAPQLRQEHFYAAVHGRIFDAIKSKRAANIPFTAFSLAQEFANDEDLGEAGGGVYLIDLAQNVVTTLQTRAHAEHITAMHMRRMVREMGTRLINAAERPNAEVDYKSPASLIAEAERIIREAAVNPADDRALHVADCTDETLKNLKNYDTGIPSGIGALDGLMRGFKKGQLCIVAGRPGMGKTALGLTLAMNAALAQNRVLFASLEMTRDDLTARLLSRLLGEPVHSGARYDDKAMEEAAKKLKRLPLYIDDTSGVTVTQIATSARRQARVKGLDILFIDYLGLVASENKHASRVHQIEDITTALKSLAKELGIPIVLLCQLNRAVESRDDKRPTLADLRDSGSIEQDADAVIFVYREEYYLNEGDEKRTRVASRKEREAEALVDIEAVKGKAELIIAKLRQGKRGTAPCRFDGKRQVFHDE
jgi:replicative DNA helicase